MIRVVVTGVGCVSPFGAGADSLREGMLSGRTTFGPVRKFDGAQYGIDAAAEIPAHVDLAGFEGSRPSRLLQMAAEEALTAAGLGRGDLDEAGLVLGTTLGSDEISAALWQQKQNLPADFGAVMSSMAECGGRALVDRWRIGGPSLTVITACAAGTNAIGLGSDLIRSRRADRVIVGGLDTLTQLIYGGFASIGALGSVCRPFAASDSREGTVLGENAAILVLESEQSARARGAVPLAEVLGYGLSNDAHHMTAPEPEGQGAALAMERCLEHAGIQADDIDYINAHGTGTRLNDPIELVALRKVLGERLSEVPVSSLKSQIGHGLSSGGAVEAIATVLALSEGFLPSTAHEERSLDDSIDFIRHPRRSDDVRIAISNSFAFGGHNACIALSVWDEALVSR